MDAMGRRPKQITGRTNLNYQPPDEVLILNDNDPDLQPIEIKLPSPPPLKYIDGYGLPAEDQLFTRPVVPEALRRIQRDSVSIKECWQKFERRQNDLQDEILWLKKQWFYRLNGYWCFINGKPTYIPPSHYELIAFMKTHTGLIPQYRERSRKLHTVFHWANNFTSDFEDQKFDAIGNRLPNRYGDKLIDTGERKLFGVVFSKGRRLAATTDAIAWVNRRIITHKNKYSGMQAQDADHGKKLWLKYTAMSRTIPWFFMPIFDGDTDPQTKIVFQDKDQLGEYGLESKIDYAKTHSSYFYDGEEIFDYYRTESGKVIKEVIYMGWEIVKNTISWSSGKIIGGFAIHESTAGEFEKQGGAEFFYLCRDSDFYHRTANGQTKSGLVNIFLPSDEGSPGFIDRYGNSLKEKARNHYLRERKHYLDESTSEGMMKYQEQLRLHPLSFAESFTQAGMGIGFNMIILDKRISELRFLERATVRGNFDWVRDFGGDVTFFENPMGRWYVSKLYPSEMANKKYWKDGHWYPLFRNKVMHCSDPFGYDETEHFRQSNGGGIAIERKDPSDNEKDITKSDKPDIVYTYSARPATKEEFCEDMLKSTIYYGGMHSPEVNIEIVREYFKRKGFGGYLYYFREGDGSYRKTAGYSLTRDTPDKIIGCAVTFVELYGHRIKHLELLQQCKDLRGKKDIKNKDLVAVFGGATHSIENDYRSEEMVDHSERDLSSWFIKKNY